MGFLGQNARVMGEASKRHLASIFRWSTAGNADWVAILASAFGMSLPILIGASMGRFTLGLGVAVGSMLVGGVNAYDTWRTQSEALFIGLVPACAASPLALALAGHGWASDAAVVVLSGAAGLIAAMGRPISTMAIRFILLLIITVAVAENMSNRGGLLLLIAAGALWTSALSLLLGALERATGSATVSAEARLFLPLRERLAAGPALCVISPAGNTRFG